MANAMLDAIKTFKSPDGKSLRIRIGTLLYNPTHLSNVERRFYCPQAFPSLDFQCRDDISEFKIDGLGSRRSVKTFRSPDHKSLMVRMNTP